MNGLLHVESRKLRTLRSTWVLTGVAVGLGAVIGAAQVLAREPQAAVSTLARTALAPAQSVWFVVVLLAVLASAGEFQHRTIRTTLLAAPQRVRVGLAKAAVSAGLGVLVVAAAAAAAVAAEVAAAALDGTSVAVGPAVAWASVAASVALGGVWAVLACALGVLTRSSVAAVTAVLLWRFVGEGLLPVVLRAPGTTRWTPSGAADALIGLGGEHVLPRAGAALLLLAYAAVLCAIGGLRLVRSDPA